MTTCIRLLTFLRPYHRWVALAALLGCATVASNIGLLSMAAYLLAAAALKPLLILLTLPIYIVRFMGVSRAVCRYAERLVGHNVTFKLLATLRVWVFSRLEPLIPGRLAAYRSGDVLARLVGDVEEVQNIYLQVVSPVVVAVAITGLTWALFALFSPLLAWVALAFLAGTAVGVPLLVGLLGRGLGERQRALHAALNAQLVDGIQGVQDLLACGQEAEYRGAVARRDRALGLVQRRMAALTGMQHALTDLMMNLALWTILLLAVPLVVRTTINGVYLAFLTLLILASFEAIQPLGQAVPLLGRSIAAGDRLFDVLDTRPVVIEPDTPAAPPASCALEFDHVSFAYEACGQAALEEITFSLAPGRRIAVVGPSGAGKSTLVRLALRLGDPVEGVIRLDGRDVRDYALDDLRGISAVVAQDTYIFNDTVRGNLLLARPDASDEEMLHALEQARLAAFVQGLPDGLGTWVGEQGLRLSGGERQRLAIARALLKDAPLVILDETTANLDPRTERAVLDALDTLMQGRATLMVTHRLVALERMDEILVLDRGCIVERGTHDALRAAHGLYRQLLDMQNAILASA